MSIRLFPSAVGFALVLLCAASAPRPALAQPSGSLLLTGGRVDIVIDQVDAAGNFLPATVRRARLMWGKPRTDSKITVSTVRYGPEVRLTVEAISVQNGTAVGPVELQSGMPDMDFVVGIPRGLHGSARLQYTADASTWSGGPSSSGETQYLVTYTLTVE